MITYSSGIFLTQYTGYTAKTKLNDFVFGHVKPLVG